MSVFTRVNHFVRHYRTALNRRRTERLIGTLPAEIRKDIGWPSQYTGLQSDGQDNRGISRL
ncbi:hypothetical protein JF546_08115 [Nitratireductor aquimarinus]|uniref:hypothetical protein n=1 Tax=Alphaproteobacteria TaxID=28211 RepID=UPI0019D3AF04|nr:MULTISPECIES: hypothetical protein [Alphaproteobacteria]MBY6023666.1 hypothetical protein [Nitratireductor sp. DP7N14-4]MBN7758616.1 hypothetical protein [Nitratireductor aquimarinus]MBN7763567.1 hypothetical protein [Nitratireductor aquibiodomus]MBN7774706.1 hypothetical protein [Nitratireductor pacificus]MBN7779567.1 hypothetical protein [Nitratireductor pacificus]